uniref:Uncharacterized protein n=1 Tax=Rhizophora mucronata TaxID=61149 RepID=A0A2P2PCX6_RHIMU
MVIVEFFSIHLLVQVPVLLQLFSTVFTCGKHRCMLLLLLSGLTHSEFSTLWI